MTDDRTRARLADVDPAVGLPALEERARTDLLDRAARAPVRTRRPRLPIALGGLVAAGLVAGAVVVLLPRPVDAPHGPVVTLGTGLSARVSCAPLPDFAVQALRTSELALSGTVERVEGGTAEIVPETVYRGAAVGLVRLRTDTAGGPALDGPVLHDGDRVLIAASDGQVAPCGLSAVSSPALLHYYERAFG